MSIRRQVLYPDSVSDDEIIIPKKRKWKIRPEDKLQVACVKMLRNLDRPFIVAQPERLNAPINRRDWFTKLGILGNAGHHELIIFTRTGVVLVEWKSAGGKVSNAQKEWAERLSGRLNIATFVCRSVDEFRAILDSF